MERETSGKAVILRFDVRRGFWYTLVGSVVVSGLAGIAAWATPGPGALVPFAFSLLAAAAGVASLCGLACCAYVARVGNGVLPLTGIVLAIVGGVALQVIFWGEGAADSEVAFDATMSICVFAVAVALLCLLSMGGRLAAGIRWLVVVGKVVIVSVAVTLVVIMWADVDIAVMLTPAWPEYSAPPSW